MLLKTFRGGVHPPQLKNLTKNLATKILPLPKRVTVPLSQHTGAVCEGLVSVGDEVKRGELIGKSDKFISSPVHASISGKVTRVYPFAHPIVGKSQAVEIEAGDITVSEFRLKSDDEVRGLGPAQTLEKIKNAGIVGMGGAAFPAHVKLSPPESKPIDSFILNGVECEPLITCDHRLMLEKSLEILKGLDVMVKILGVKKAYIAIENNKKDTIELMKKTIRGYLLSAIRSTPEVISLPAKYPQGAEKQLIKAVLNREIPEGGLPMDVGCVVNNVGTAFAIYEAVYMEKPLIERRITVTGDCIKEPANLLVPIGTLVSDIADFCGGFVKDIEKFIIGGPMMGIAQYTLDLPVVKGTNALVFLSKEKVMRFKEESCVRCGTCVSVCPLDLVPINIVNFIKKSRFEEASSEGLPVCIECGACAYECPARIPLLDYLKFGKIKEKELAGK